MGIRTPSTPLLGRRHFMQAIAAASIAQPAFSGEAAPLAAGPSARPSRIRHYVIATQDRDFVCDQLYEFLGMPPTPKSGPDRTLQFGFYSTMMRVGATMLEVVQPARPDFHLNDWLVRRGGDGGYMVVAQTWDGKALVARAKAERLRLNRDQLFLEQHQVQFDEGEFGTFFEFYQYSPEDDWWGNPRSGPYSDGRVAAEILACEVAVREPLVVAERAARVFLGRQEGTDVHFLDRTVKFVPVRGTRTGLTALELKAKQSNRVGDWARIAGVQFRLVG